MSRRKRRTSRPGPPDGISGGLWIGHCQRKADWAVTSAASAMGRATAMSRQCRVVTSHAAPESVIITKKIRRRPTPSAAREVGRQPSEMKTIPPRSHPATAAVPGRGCPADHRMMINEIFFRTRTGCPWRDVPEGFGNWKTVCNRHRRRSGDRTWEKILDFSDRPAARGWRVAGRGLARRYSVTIARRMLSLAARRAGRMAVTTPPRAARMTTLTRVW